MAANGNAMGEDSCWTRDYNKQRGSHHWTTTTKSMA